MTVTPDGLGALPEARKDGVTRWFVDIGEPEPQMSTAELRAAMVRGEVPEGTLVWRPGMDRWIPCETVRDIPPTDAVQHPAHEPPVTAGASGEEESDPPRDTRVEQRAPFDTDPAPPPDGDSEPSAGGAAARTHRTRDLESARGQLDTIPEVSCHAPANSAKAERHRGLLTQERGHDDQDAAAGRQRSLWRQPQVSLPPRPGLSGSAVPRPAVKASTERQGSGPAALTGKDSASSSATTDHADPSAAKAPDDELHPLPSLRPTTPGVGSVSLAAREAPEGSVLLGSTAPTSARTSMLSEAPTNPRQNALPSAEQAVTAPQAKPDGVPRHTPELEAGAAIDGQNEEAPRAEDEPLDPQESSGAPAEAAHLVRARMDALRARYLRLMVAVAVAAAVCAALVTALLMRRATPVVPRSRTVPLEEKTPRAQAPPMDPTKSVEAPPVEALSTESPPEAPPNELPADRDAAPSSTLARYMAARHGSSDKSSAGTSETVQSSDTHTVDSRPTRDPSGLDGGEVKPRAAAVGQAEPAVKAEPAPASGPAAASSKTWKASDPGF
jgi:hypothetical protein